MKHLKLFEAFLAPITLYHATLSQFDKFHNGLTFFSTTSRFALTYAATKANDMQVDNNPILWQCEISGNIFDIRIPEDYNRLEAVLPDFITVPDESGIRKIDIDKEEYLRNVTGTVTHHPEQDVVEALSRVYATTRGSGGDIICLENDDDAVYSLAYDRWESIKSQYVTGEGRECTKYGQIEAFARYRDAAVEALNAENPGVNFKYKKHLIESYITDFEAGRELRKRLLPPAIEELRLAVVASGECHKYPKHSYVEEMSVNWNYFENKTIMNLLKELGYDGYIANEGDLTYAIFEPEKTVKNCKIISGI